MMSLSETYELHKLSHFFFILLKNNILRDIDLQPSSLVEQEIKFLRVIYFIFNILFFCLSIKCDQSNMIMILWAWKFSLVSFFKMKPLCMFTYIVLIGVLTQDQLQSFLLDSDTFRLS